jgi:uncharacterized protein (TIGR02996 family)
VETELLAAVFAAPDDDAPRLVYADWLQQRGDPRGELIMLQVARARGRAKKGQRRREDELLDEHASKWLRSLGAYADKHTRFERGFVVACSANAINHNPAWALVRECSVPPTRDGSPATNLRVAGAADEHVIKLAKLREPLALEELHWSGPWDRSERAIAAFGKIGCLPALRRLRLDGEVPDMSWAWTAPCAAKLDELSLYGDPREVPRWRERLESTHVARFQLIANPYNPARASRVGLARDATGAMSRLIAIAPATTRLDDQLIRLIESFPKGSITSARVGVPSAVWKAA